MTMFTPIISLGSYCHISSFLKKHSFKKYSTPFDWTTANSLDIVDCISNNFSVFFR
jgi:hypothetical protein